MGAYDAANGGTIYLDRRLQSDPKALESVYAEELGHHLDAKLGGPDAAGDEGAIFSRSLLSGPIGDKELNNGVVTRWVGVFLVQWQDGLTSLLLFALRKCSTRLADSVHDFRLIYCFFDGHSQVHVSRTEVTVFPLVWRTTSA